MRCLIAMLVLGGFAGACGSEVDRLELRDPRLPPDARRWLADNEDDVAIARAGVDDADHKLERAEDYRDRLSRLARSDKLEKKAGAEGKKAAEAFVVYAEELVSLRKMELAAAEKINELAKARLARARAETAVRYDLKVYELEPLAKEVEKLKKAVAAMTQDLETKKAAVEKKADSLWNAYGAFVKSGGETAALWAIDLDDDS